MNYIKNYTHKIFYLASFILSVTIATATNASPENTEIGMVTGAKTGTYIAFGNDIAKVSQQEGQKVIIKASNGSVDNIKRITESGENAGLGIVQSDVLGFLRRSQNAHSQNVARKLRMIFPFYKEEVHILARKNIQSLSDLVGKRVVIGQQGSGNMLTAMNLLNLSGIQPDKYLQIAPPEGVVAVLAGEADALIFTGGKPVPLFKNLEGLRTANNGANAHLLDQIHFIPVGNESIYKEYGTAEINNNDYDFVSNPVSTISVTAILVSYDFSSKHNKYYRDRCQQLSNIGNAIRKHLPKLQSSGHPKWQQVDLYREVGMWKRDKCSWQNIENISTKKANRSSKLEQDLLRVINGK